VAGGVLKRKAGGRGNRRKGLSQQERNVQKIKMAKETCRSRSPCTSEFKKPIGRIYVEKAEKGRRGKLEGFKNKWKISSRLADRDQGKPKGH